MQSDAPFLVPWPDGQVTLPVSRLIFAFNTALLSTLTRPAGCGQDWAPLFVEQLVPGGTRQRREQRREEHSGRGGGVVGNHRVVDQIGRKRVKERDAASVPARHVVGDDVVGYANRIPRSQQLEGRLRRVSGDTRPPRSVENAGAVGEVQHIGSIDVLQSEAAAAAAVGGVA